MAIEETVSYTITVPASVAWAVGAARAAKAAGVGLDQQEQIFGLSDQAFLELFIREQIDGWAKRAMPTVVISGVPQTVSRRQARQALIETGLIDQVQPAIDAIPDPKARAMMQSEWDDSQVFERSRPALIQMASALGLGDEQLDDLFRLAATK